MREINQPSSITVKKITRKNFVSTILLGSLSVSMPGLSMCHPPQRKGAEDWWDTMLLHNDEVVERYLTLQATDRSDVNYGGVPSADRLYHPGAAAGVIQRMTASMVSPKSQFYNSEELMERMQMAADFLLDRQHPDGTVDLITTNFHSTPDTGFVTEPVAISYKLLGQQNFDELKTLMGKLQSFLVKAADAMSVGGIHTPNHRWVVSMALSRVHELFPNEKYINRIERWLAEGIDIDRDGQFTERSTAVYSPLTDRCLITIAEKLGKAELLEPVRRNLDMTLYYIHPNGEIATEASRRQDQYLARMPDAYYYPYRYMALYDKNAEFAAMAENLEGKPGAKSLSRYLPYFLENNHLKNGPVSDPIPREYKREFQDSNLVRIRRGNYDATILGMNSTLFTFQYKEAVLQAFRMATAFFGKGQFNAEEIRMEGEAVVLEQCLEGPYYQPIGEELIAKDGNWENMPRDLRPQSEIQIIRYRLIVDEIERGFSLDIMAEGTDHVPVAIEFSLRDDVILHGVVDKVNTKGVYFFDGDTAKVTKGDATFVIEGGIREHDWTQLRGAENKVPGKSIYMTMYTPFRKKIKIYTA